MPDLCAHDLADAMERFQREIEARCIVAFSCGCRLAVSEAQTRRFYPYGEGLSAGFEAIPGTADPAHVHVIYEFVVLSPGEKPPSGRRWTIYESRDGQAVGRPA